MRCSCHMLFIESGIFIFVQVRFSAFSSCRDAVCLSVLKCVVYVHMNSRFYVCGLRFVVAVCIDVRVLELVCEVLLH
jgi:hypothetical protein